MSPTTTGSCLPYITQILHDNYHSDSIYSYLMNFYCCTKLANLTELAATPTVLNENALKTLPTDYKFLVFHAKLLQTTISVIPKSWRQTPHLLATASMR